MKVLHIDASARVEGSHSRSLSSYFIDSLRQHGVVLPSTASI